MPEDIEKMVWHGSPHCAREPERRLTAGGMMKAVIFRGVVFGVITCVAAAWHLRAEDGQKTIALPGDRVFPVGVAATVDGTLYVGSAGAGGILRVPPGAAQAEPWIAPGAFHTHSIFGAFADQRSQMLWVCSNELSTQGTPGIPTATSSSLIGFDLKSGEGKVKADLPLPALCDDIAVAHDGSVYVTNGAAPQILKYNAVANRLDVWFTDPSFQPKQGIGLDGVAASSADGSVYVDTYTEGKFFRIPVDRGKPTSATLMTLSAEMDSSPRPLILPGALRLIYGDAFLLIEASGRLDRITIEGSAATIYTIRDGLNTPSGFAQTEGTTWVAEGQLPSLFGESMKIQKPKFPFRITGVDY